VASLPEVGEWVDGFHVEEKLHTGGMGVVYRVTAAEDPGFPLVMKVPRLGYGEPAETITTYEQELTVMSVLRGPFAPRFVAAGDLATQPYLVLEYVEGPSLRDWVLRAPIPPDEVARLGAALATALHGLHQQEVIHLDVKPSNVIVRPTGEAVLIDFGLANHAHYPDLLAEEMRRPVGSAPYISPEQVLGIRTDPRSDIFALGVVLYELATGELPFGSPTSFSGLRRRLHQEPVPPRARNPGVPEWLQEVVLHCLDPDASRRYGSASQVAFDLAHPGEVVVTERGRRTRRAGIGTRLRRWVKAAGMEPASLARPSAHLAGAPIVLAAVATRHGSEALFQAQRDAVAKLMAGDTQVRLACVTIIPPTPVVGAESEEDIATSQRIKHLVLLKHWAEPLQLPAGKVSFHVLEGGDAAATLLDYARANGVDHIVTGAPPPGLPLRSVWGTFATRLVGEAPCTVTLVRPSAAHEAAAAVVEEAGGGEGGGRATADDVAPGDDAQGGGAGKGIPGAGGGPGDSPPPGVV
jgi:nucleotide-binding universal stress UspA family protein